jgi:hypothetical protein
MKIAIAAIVFIALAVMVSKSHPTSQQIRPLVEPGGQTERETEHQNPGNPNFRLEALESQVQELATRLRAVEGKRAITSPTPTTDEER